jgi:C4-dicarboxylate transporter DctM subunit
MIKAGYPKDFASAIAAAGGTLGVIIPPSIPMITYGVVAGVSISTLFTAGIVPGIIIGLSLIGVIYYYAKKLDLPKGEPTSLNNLISAFREAILALLMPVIILGGIYGGVFTPTEAAAVAVVYAFVVSVFIYKELQLKDLGPVILKGAISTSVVLFVIATSASFSWIITSAQIPAKVTTAMMSVSSNAIVITTLINIMLLFLGSFLETQAIILLVAPILLPLTASLGIHPVLLGIIIVVNTSVGMITPPMAVNLFVACGISGLKVEEISRKIISFLIVEIIIVLLITNVPQISLFLPQMLQ